MLSFPRLVPPVEAYLSSLMLCRFNYRVGLNLKSDAAAALHVNDGSKASNDDLPMRATLGQVGERPAAFRKRINGGNVRLDVAGDVKIQKLRRVLAIGFGIALGPGAPKHADDLAAFQQNEIQRNQWDARGKSDHQEASLPGDRAQRCFGIVAAHGVIDDIRSARAAGLLEEVTERLFAVFIEGSSRINDSIMRAVREAQIELLLSRAGGNHARTHHPSEFDGSQAHASRRA